VGTSYDTSSRSRSDMWVPIMIKVVESYDKGSRNRSIMWVSLVILVVETVILFGYLS
jgi:hypothetical protein